MADTDTNGNTCHGTAVDLADQNDVDSHQLHDDNAINESRIKEYQIFNNTPWYTYTACLTPPSDDDITSYTDTEQHDYTINSGVNSQSQTNKINHITNVKRQINRRQPINFNHIDQARDTVQRTYSAVLGRLVRTVYKYSAADEVRELMGNMLQLDNDDVKDSDVLQHTEQLVINTTELLCDQSTQSSQTSQLSQASQSSNTNSQSSRNNNNKKRTRSNREINFSKVCSVVLLTVCKYANVCAMCVVLCVRLRNQCMHSNVGHMHLSSVRWTIAHQRLHNECTLSWLLSRRQTQTPTKEHDSGKHWPPYAAWFCMSHQLPLVDQSTAASSDSIMLCAAHKIVEHCGHQLITKSVVIEVSIPVVQSRQWVMCSYTISDYTTSTVQTAADGITSYTSTSNNTEEYTCVSQTSSNCVPFQHQASAGS